MTPVSYKISAKQPAVKGRKAARPQPARGGMALALGAALAGCAGLSPQAMPPAAAPLQVEPMMRVETAPLSAGSAYQLGKQALADRRNETALAWFDRAVALQPTWVDPYNGRAVALSRLGRTDEAVAALRGAIQLQPNAAHLHGNLSMLLIRSGQFEPARVHVEQAIRLAPEDTLVWPGVRDQLAQLVAAAKIQAERAVAAPEMAQQTALAAKPALSAATAPASPAASLPTAPAVAAVQMLAGATTSATIAAPAQGMRWVQQSPHILELKAAEVPAVAVSLPAPPMVARVIPRETLAVPVRQATQAVPATVVPAAPAVTSLAAPVVTSTVALAQMVLPPISPAPAAAEGARSLKVEFSNGAGREGLARHTAEQLTAAHEVGAVRLTNHRHYKVMRTEIQYRSEQDRAAAATLARALGLSVALVHEPGLTQGVGIRVLLGHDAARQAAPTMAVQRPGGASKRAGAEIKT